MKTNISRENSGLLDEGNDGGIHARVDSRRVRATGHSRPGKSIVFGDVDKFDGVRRAVLVGHCCTRGLVSVLEESVTDDPL